jgi:acetyl esterase
MSLTLKLGVLGSCIAALEGTGAARPYDDIEYARPQGASLKMDGQVPEGQGPFPAAIIVHGGAWVAGDRKRSVEPLFKPLSDAGIAWFSISYRLASVANPDGLLQEITSTAMVGRAIDDVRQAVAYLKKHAVELRIDANRMVLIGESAGAQLASMAALKPDPQGPVNAVVAFYSPSDLVSLVQNMRQIPDSIRQAVRGSVFEQLMLTALRQVSPVNWIRKDAPPFLLIHGTSDTLVPIQQSRDMCDSMTRAGASCELFTVRGGEHGMRRWESESSMTAYKGYMVDWLRKTLSVTRASR